MMTLLLFSLRRSSLPMYFHLFTSFLYPLYFYLAMLSLFVFCRVSCKAPDYLSFFSLSSVYEILFCNPHFREILFYFSKSAINLHSCSCLVCFYQSCQIFFRFSFGAGVCTIRSFVPCCILQVLKLAHTIHCYSFSSIYFHFVWDKKFSFVPFFPFSVIPFHVTNQTLCSN